jgi:hypothetical protein
MDLESSQASHMDNGFTVRPRALREYPSREKEKRKEREKRGIHYKEEEREPLYLYY